MLKLRRRAVSPVIASVILAAVTITVAVAASFWMSGIAGQYTQFEKVEIQSAVCDLDEFGNWVITIGLKNTGTSASTLMSVYVNNVPTNMSAVAPIEVVGGEGNDLPPDGLMIESGVSGYVTVWIGGNHPTLSSGTTINIKIHSAIGMDYIKLVRLV